MLEERGSRGWSRERKVERRGAEGRGRGGVVGGLDEGISTEIWILDSIDRRPSSKGGIWTRHRQSVRRRTARGRGGQEGEGGKDRGCGRKFQREDKGARARSISAPSNERVIYSEVSKGDGLERKAEWNSKL